MSSFREVINNQNILDYIKNRDIRLDYSISDFYNTFFLSLGGGYSFADKDYYSTNQITSELTYKKSLLLDYGNHGLHFNFAVDKLVPFLKTTAKFKSAFSSYSTYNFIKDRKQKRSRKYRNLFDFSANLTISQFIKSSSHARLHVFIVLSHIVSVNSLCNFIKSIVLHL